MILLGLALWLTAIAWPGWQMPIMLLGVALVVFAVSGLLTENLDPDRMSEGPPPRSTGY